MNNMELRVVWIGYYWSLGILFTQIAIALSMSSFWPLIYMLSSGADYVLLALLN